MTVAIRADVQLLLNHRSPSSSLIRILCGTRCKRAELRETISLSKTYARNQVSEHRSVIAFSTSIFSDARMYGRHMRVIPFSGFELDSATAHGNSKWPNRRPAFQSKTSIVSFVLSCMACTLYLCAAKPWPTRRRLFVSAVAKRETEEFDPAACIKMSSKDWKSLLPCPSCGKFFYLVFVKLPPDLIGLFCHSAHSIF